jgi:hypothetical protein
LTDPITAHGITNALRDADTLAKTIRDGASLAEYQTIRDDLSIRFFEISDRVASLDWDIPTVKQYHRMMSREMGREEEALVARDEAASRAVTEDARRRRLSASIKTANMALHE